MWHFLLALLLSMEMSAGHSKWYSLPMHAQLCHAIHITVVLLCSNEAVPTRYSQPFCPL